MQDEAARECEKILNEGYEYIKNRAWGKAKVCYEKALAIRDDNEKAWVNLGRCYDRLGSPGKAFECYEEALRCNFSHKHRLVSQGALLAKDRKYKEALQCFDAAIEIDPRMEIALDSRQKLLQTMIQTGILKKVPLKVVEVISEGGRYCLNAGGDLVKSLRGNVLKAKSRALMERIFADFEGRGDLLLEDGIIMEPRIFGAYVFASTKRDFIDEGDDLFQKLPGLLRSDPIFEPAAGYPITSTYQEAQQGKVKLFLEACGFSLNSWDRYTGDEWRKITNMFQDIVSDLTGFQKAALIDLGSLHGGQFVMTLLYLLGRCDEGEWARAIFSRTNDVCKIIGDEPVGPESVTDEERDTLIELIISGYEERCFIAKLYLEASKKEN